MDSPQPVPVSREYVRGGLPRTVARAVLQAHIAARDVAAVQTDPFNAMVRAGVTTIINERYRHTTVGTLGTTMMAVSFDNVSIGAATSKEQSGAERTVTPHECVLRKLSYTFPVMATMRVERYINRAAQHRSVWGEFDPITGAPLHADRTADGGDGPCTDGGLQELSVQSGAAGGAVAGATGGLPQALMGDSTDNPGDTHELVAEAQAKALQVRWALTEVHSAGSQCVMELPAQIGSEVCITSRAPLLNPNAASYGIGEFIPNGTYRITVPQRRVQNNRALVTRLKNGGVQCQIRSVLEHRHRSTSTITVKLTPGWTSPERVWAAVELPYVDRPIPLMAIFRLMGVATVHQAARLIARRGVCHDPAVADEADGTQGEGAGPHDAAFEAWLHDLLRPHCLYKARAKQVPDGADLTQPADGSADDAARWLHAPVEYATPFPDFETMTRREVGEWVSARATTGPQYNKDAKWMSTLSTETLPQLGLGMAPRTIAAKAMLLAYMVWRAAVTLRASPSAPAGHSVAGAHIVTERATAACMWDADGALAGCLAHGGAQPEHRDALDGAYYATGGFSITHLIRQCFRRQSKSVAMTVRNSPQAQGSACIGEALNKRTVTNSLRYAMNTGNWGERKGTATPSQQETTQQRQQGNLLSQRTFITALRTPLREKTKASEARDLHPSHWGFLCPGAHSEGKQCGLRVQPALGAHFTNGQEARSMLPQVCRLLAGRVAGFVPAPFPTILSGRVAAPLRPYGTSVRQVTQQHMVRWARNSRKLDFKAEQERCRLEALGGAGAQLGADKPSAPPAPEGAPDEQAIALAAMKWPGSAAARASSSLVSEDLAGVRRDLLAHAAALRTELDLRTCATVFVNGIPLGAVPHATEAAAVLRNARRRGWLPYDIEIAVQDGGNSVWVGAQTGELRRPLWVLTADAREIVCRTWDAWRRACEPPAQLWTRLMDAGVVEYVGPNEVTNLLIAPDASAEAWSAMQARGVSHVEIHPALMLSASLSCLPYLDSNQGPRNAYYHAQVNSASSEPPACLANETSLTTLVHPATRAVATAAETALFPRGFAAGGMLMVAVQAAHDNVEDSNIMNADAAQAGMLAVHEVHTYMAEAARSGAAARAAEAKVFGVPDEATHARVAARYDTLEQDGLPRVGTRISPGTAVIGLQRRRQTARGRHVSYDGAIFTSARDRACEVFDVRVSPSMVRGRTLAVVQTAAFRRVEVGDKISVSPSQKGSIAALRPQSALPVSPTVGRPQLIMNPHAIPSRMTQGKDVEGLVAFAALLAGHPCADGTPWGSRYTMAWAKRTLRALGVAPCGHHTFYDGVTGKALRMRVFAVPQFVMRLRQMAGNKINMRANGPRNPTTGQATEGRSVGGGQRLGAMENDALASAGVAGVLQERFRDAADAVSAWVCRGCGNVGVPPAPAGVSGASAGRSARTDLESVVWHAGMGADTQARCLQCNTGQHMVHVHTRKALLLLKRELLAIGVHMKLHVNSGVHSDTTVAPSPSVVRRAVARHGMAAYPRAVPVDPSGRGRLTPQGAAAALRRSAAAPPTASTTAAATVGGGAAGLPPQDSDSDWSSVASEDFDAADSFTVGDDGAAWQQLTDAWEGGDGSLPSVADSSEFASVGGSLQ